MVDCPLELYWRVDGGGAVKLQAVVAGAAYRLWSRVELPVGWTADGTVQYCSQPMAAMLVFSGRTPFFSGRPLTVEWNQALG